MLKFIIISLLLLSSQLCAQNKQVTLQLIWKHQFQFAGFYMAKELGYYDDVGIDIEILERDAYKTPVELIENKKVDFAIGRASLLIDKSNSKDIVALGTVFQHSPLILIVKTGIGIDSISDLKNRKVMIPIDLQKSAAIKYMLMKNGVILNDLNLYAEDFNLDSFIDGDIEAFIGYLSNEPFLLEEKGVKYQVYYPKDFGFDFYSDILFTSSTFIKENPKLTKDFYEASKKGWKYAFENKAKTAQIIYNKYNTQNKSLINLVQEGEELKKIAYDQDGFMFHLDVDRLQSTVDIYKILGFMDKNVNFDEFIYEYNSDDVFKLKLEHNDAIHLVLLLLLIFILLLTVIIYYSVHKKWLLTKNNLQREIQTKEKEIKQQNTLILEQAKMTALGNMLSNIAHQWRQPINTISINVSMLEISMKLGKKVEEKELIQCIELTSEQIQYLSETIDVFRNFLISDTVEITQVKLTDIISQSKSLISDSYKHKNITIIEDLKNFELLSNRSNLIQVFINILNNAKDAIVNSNVEDRYVFISTSVKNSEVVISIKDSAGGIEEDALDKVFEPYFSTKLEAQGTGLGLYIVHEIVTKNLKGTIEARNAVYSYNSKEYSGAEFLITLPLHM